MSSISQVLTAVLLLLGGLIVPLLKWFWCWRPTPVSEGPLGAYARLIPYEVSRQVLATSLRLVSVAQQLRTEWVGRLVLLLSPEVGLDRLGAQWGGGARARAPDRALARARP